MIRNLSKPILAVFVVLSLVLATATGATAATVTEPNYSSDLVGDDYVDEDRLDIAAWNASTMDSVTMAYDDEGDARQLPIVFNDSADAPDNQIAYALDNVEDSDLGVFPRKDEADNAASYLDASEHTVGGQNTSELSVTQSDGTTASGVDAITISSGSAFEDGAVAYSSYTNVSITEDPTKRVAMVGVNVNTLEATAHVTVALEDADGDTKELYINSSRSVGDADVIANQTGDGFFTQEKLADLSTQGSGDGTFDAIEEVNVTVQDGDFEGEVFAFDAGKKSFMTLGEEKVDTDDDDELETETIEEVITPGEIQIHSIDTIPSAFEDATIHDLGLLEVHWPASKRAAEHTKLTVEDATNYGGYDKQGTYHSRLELYAWIDLTHHNPVLKSEQPLVTDRYKSFGYVEDAGDTDFDELDSFTDVTGSLEGADQDATLDTSIQPGQTYVVKKLVVYQEDELPQILGSGDSDSDQTGSSGFWGGSNPVAGFVNWAMAGLASIVAVVLGALKLRG